MRLAIILLLFFSGLSFAETVQLDRKDYLRLIVSSYVHGFKEFDTTVTAFDDSVSIGIYHDVSTQDEKRANQLATRFRVHVPELLSRYEWAEGTKVLVNVYSEDRSIRGY